MKPFLLLATRAEDAAADNEYDAFLGFTGLDESTLHRVRLEQPAARAGRPRRLVGHLPRRRAVQRQRPGRRQVAGAAAGRGRAAPRLLDAVVARDFPFLGACYGIGVDRHPPGRHGRRDVQRADRPGPGHADRRRDAPTRCSPTCRTRSRRSSGTRRRSATCRRHAVHLASSPGCPVQAFRVGRQRLRHPVPPRARHRRALHAHRRLQARRLLRARPGRVGQGDGPGRAGRRAAQDAADLRAALRRRDLPERWWRPRLTGARVGAVNVTESYRAARDLLLDLREDPDRAHAEFAWPDVGRHLQLGRRLVRRRRPRQRQARPGDRRGGRQRHRAHLRRDGRGLRPGRRLAGRARACAAATP